MNLLKWNKLFVNGGLKIQHLKIHPLDVDRYMNFDFEFEQPPMRDIIHR